MDIASGTFTAETGGIYTITFSGQADVGESEGTKLYLLHNGTQLPESYTHSYSHYHTSEIFSRTMVRKHTVFLLVPQKTWKT